MRFFAPVLVLISLSALAGCNPSVGGGGATAPTPIPAPAPAPVVAAPPPVAQVLVCKDQGGDAFVKTGKTGTLYHTVGENVMYVEGLVPEDKTEFCLTKGGNKVEASCFTEGGACAADVKVKGIGSAPVPKTHSASLFATSGTTTSAASASSVSTEELYRWRLSAGRQIAKLFASDKAQGADIATLKKCAAGDSAACDSFKEPVVTPVPTEATVEGSVTAAPAPEAAEPPPVAPRSSARRP